ncbi:hypothetical protein HGG72_00455 [Ochrobactrum pecoris]|nr:hypothetical protein [Brucella pecoris]
MFFVAAIFLGDVWLVKITLPLSMLILPFILFDRSQLGFKPFPTAAIPLLCFGAMMVLQCAVYRNNPAFRPRSDMAIWMPLVYAGTAIIALRNTKITETSLLRAMYSGGMITSIIMLGMISFAPSNLFLVPGQNAAQVETSYAESLKKSPSPQVVVQAQPPRAASKSESSQTAADSTALTSVSQDAAIGTAEDDNLTSVIIEEKPVALAGREEFSSGAVDKAFYDIKNKSKKFSRAIELYCRFSCLSIFSFSFFRFSIHRRLFRDSYHHNAFTIWNGFFAYSDGGIFFTGRGEPRDRNCHRRSRYLHWDNCVVRLGRFTAPYTRYGINGISNPILAEWGRCTWIAYNYWSPPFRIARGAGPQHHLEST